VNKEVRMPYTQAQLIWDNVVNKEVRNLQGLPPTIVRSCVERTKASGVLMLIGRL
jgi:hypothetical protein